MAARSVPALTLEDENAFRLEAVDWKAPIIPVKPMVILRSRSTVVVYDTATNSVTVHPFGDETNPKNEDFCPLCQQPIFRANEEAGETHDYFKYLRLVHVREEESSQRPNNYSNQSFEGLDSDTLNTGYYFRFFQEDRKIGSGGFGGVYVTQHHLNGVNLGIYAIKKVNLFTMSMLIVAGAGRRQSSQVERSAERGSIARAIAAPQHHCIQALLGGIIPGFRVLSRGTCEM